jgi:hypothetical protein
MNPTEEQIVNAMTEYGGSFVQALANAFRKADDGNAERIRLAFPEIWNIYTNLARLKYEPYSKD